MFAGPTRALKMKEKHKNAFTRTYINKVMKVNAKSMSHMFIKCFYYKEYETCCGSLNLVREALLI